MKYIEYMSNTLRYVSEIQYQHWILEAYKSDGYYRVPGLTALDLEVIQSCVDQKIYDWSHAQPGIFVRSKLDHDKLYNFGSITAFSFLNMLNYFLDRMLH